MSDQLAQVETNPLRSQLGPRPTIYGADFENNLILKTDYYKLGHYRMLPPGTTKMRSYIEARGGDFPNTIFFGPQIAVQKYLTTPITKHDVAEAEFFTSTVGAPFNKPGWDRIVNKHGGFIPLKINAVKEGSNVLILNALMTIESTDDDLPWLNTYYEPVLLRSAFYGSTVATLSWSIKQLIREYMIDTCDNLDDLNYKLHDFGSRGVSSGESAGIGGAAHLVNFWGSDTLEGAVAAMKYYDCDVPLRSVPASEHSVTTIWGREHEIDAYRNMLKQFAQPGCKVSIVADSYDLFGMIRTMVGGELKQTIIDSEAVVIIRPDSGRPHEIVLKTISELMDVFGFTVNSKGYRVLPKYIRVIQGDGIEYDSIKLILETLKKYKISVDNIFFGMGGALLQKVHRDTGQWANKVCEGLVNGRWIDVFKDPITDSHKQSKRGNQMLYQSIYDETLWKTSRVEVENYSTWAPALDTIYNGHGELLRFQPFDNVRDIAKFNG